MDELLMMYGEARHCPDCACVTVFIPVEDDCWACTACDTGFFATAA